MYKHLCIIILATVALPFSSHAAYNDVSLTTDTVITVGSYTLSVSGATASVESVTVNSADLTVTLPAGASIIVRSSDRYILNVTGVASTYYSSECDSSYNTLTISVPGGSNPTETARITPSSETCSVATATAGSGSSSGLSRVSSPSYQAVSRIAVTSLAPVANISTLLPTVNQVIFSVDLVRGMTSPDISNLQSVLGQDKTIYPEGLVTGYFGPATENAVRRFQAKYGIAQVGRVGPATRAKLNSLSIAIAPITPATSVAQSVNPVATGLAVFTINLRKGSSNSDVARLQKLLNMNVDTQIASEGPGSPGNETEIFGSLTEMAVGKFQVKYNVAKPSDPGYGTVGPMTRAKLLEIFGNQ